METSVIQKIGQRIRDIRKQRGWSQEELGEKAGFHFSYIGGVERAEKNITLVNLLKIADALDVQIMDLFMYTKYQESALNEKLLDIDSTKGAFQIEDASQKIDSEMRELYFSAIASLKVQLRHNKNK